MGQAYVIFGLPPHSYRLTPSFSKLSLSLHIAGFACDIAPISI